MLRNLSWFHRTLLLIGLLLLSSLSATNLTPDIVHAQTTVEPVLDIPPSYYRPSFDNWLVQHMIRFDRNDPINIIVYGPADPTRFNPGMIIEAVRSAEDPDYPDWFWNEGNVPPPYSYAWDRECFNPLGYNPISTEDLSQIDSMWATTECPAIIPDPLSDRQRLRFRQWDFFDGDWEVNASYLSASFTEDFAVPFRCSNDQASFGASHCLTEFDGGRDTVDRLIREGANNLGWKVRSYDKLEAYPPHQNIQPGPYDGVDDYRNITEPGCDPSIDPFCQPAPIYTPDMYILTASGDVRVICVDTDTSSDYCDQKPAERPLAISNLTPANGSFLVPGQTTNFRVTLRYSDELRAIDDVTFSLTYTDTAGTQQTLIQPASLWSGGGNNGIWEAALAVPVDVALDPVTGTQIAGLEIEICDNHGQQTGNADDTACWTYRNLRYVLRDLPTCTDTAFVIDTTSSMSSILEEIEDAAIEMVEQIFTTNPDARVAVIEYRDGEEAAFGARTRLELSGDQGAIVNAINRLSARDGGDDREFVLSGVMEAVNLSWRESEDKVILLIGDAEAKDPEPITGHTTSSVVSAAVDEGIAIYGLPVQGRGIVSFRLLANGTGGTIYSIIDPQNVVAEIQEACNLP